LQTARLLTPTGRGGRGGRCEKVPGIVHQFNAAAR
jgi:hypothetical protein